jgi:hypothetical protein
MQLEMSLPCSKDPAVFHIKNQIKQVRNLPNSLFNIISNIVRPSTSRSSK